MCCNIQRAVRPKAVDTVSESCTVTLQGNCVPLGKVLAVHVGMTFIIVFCSIHFLIRMGEEGALSAGSLKSALFCVC